MTNSFALLMATSGLAAACAITMTPAQQLAWDRWKACDHFATVQMHQIQVDGGIQVSGREFERDPFRDCMQQMAAEQVRKGAEVGDASVDFDIDD